MSVGDFLLALLEEEPWRAHANCLGVGPQMFFPERGQSQRRAKEICDACVVHDECHEYAERAGEEYGIWGGQIRQRKRNQQINTDLQIADPVLVTLVPSTPASEDEDSDEVRITGRFLATG